MKLGLQAYCRYFDMCVWETCGTNFRALFVPNKAQIGQFTVFVFWFEKFPLDSLETWFFCKLTFCRYVKDAAQGPNFILVFGHFLQHKFICFTSLLLHMLIASTFRCVEYGSHRPKFLDHFEPQMNKKFRVFFAILSKHFLWIHNNPAPYVLLELLSKMHIIWASKAQFLGHFGSQSK